MELKSLYTVKAIVETGSYQKAAKVLNYAQSTITFQIKQLENELSVKLFEKNRNKMELTQEGKEVLPMINKVIDATEELLCFKNNENEIRGTLKVALPETLVTYKMQPIFREFKEKAPNVKLSLQVMNCYAIYEQMLNGDIDIAIHYNIGKYPKSVITKNIDTYPLVLVSSTVLDECQRDFISSNQKKSVCHIQNDPNALYMKIFNQYLKKKDITLETELELWSIESIKLSVMSNLGVAFLPRFTVETELEQGVLNEINTDIINNEITAVYAYNKNKWQSPAMSLFLQIIDDFYEIK
ncbi:LysR family transcriptional regulator [Clostridioides difficile]|nr:LysR family transcriptional regulator [Clostridioides difficile]